MVSQNDPYLTIFILVLCASSAHNRKRFADLNSILDNSDPNSLFFLDSLQFIRRYNYASERHPVITDDGYIVNLFRIPSAGPPVVLVHGIGDSSDSWLVLGPEMSLAYQLADSGFDVWLYNSRGNKYSKDHTKNIPRRDYWNFSFEEMGTQDLPATIDYILNRTNRRKLNYVGFSQGSTIFFVLCSLRPEYNDKIIQTVLLAPVAWVSRVRYPFIEVLTRRLKELTSFTKKLGLYELFPSSLLLNVYHARVCNESSPAKVLCDIEYFLSYGLRDITNLPKDKLPIIASHIPAGASTKTFVHYLQGIAGKGFQRFDHGATTNKLIYGHPIPPSYNVSLVSTPVTMFFSESDRFSTPYDTNTLLNKLPPTSRLIMFNKSLDFTHLEFVYGTRVKMFVNEPVIRLLSVVN